MKQIERIEKSIAQRKRFARGRRGVHTQVLLSTRAIYTYLLEVNRYLCEHTGDDMSEARVKLQQAGMDLTAEVEQWLAGE